MNRVSAPLRPDDTGTAVADLQRCLIVLLAHGVVQVERARQTELLEGLRAELREQSYRGATADTIRLFQEQRGVNADGLVDDVTAALLNAALGEIDPPADDLGSRTPQTVVGQVLDHAQTPFAALVVVFQESDAGSVQLGKDDTDPEGRYAVRYVTPTPSAGQTLRVTAFDGEGQRRAESALQVSRPVEVVNLVVQPHGSAYEVSGTVGSTTRAGVGGLRVAIVDKNIGGDVPLAETSTDPNGAYRIRFSYQGEKPRPDLQARVYSNASVLGSSAVRYRAANPVVLDLLLPATATTALASEYETLTRHLAPHYGGSLADLDENDERSDITYLANRSGWDARAVALAVMADRLSGQTVEAEGEPAIDPALFYALLRAGAPAGDQLFRAEPDRVARLWTRAIAQGLVPADLEAGLPGAIAAFRRLQARYALDTPTTAGRSTLGELLAVSLPDADATQRELFAGLKTEHGADLEGFWTAVERAFGDQPAERLRADGRLAYLTLNNAGLIRRLHAAEDGPPDAEQLVSRGFYRAAAWQDVLDDELVPPDVPGGGIDARRVTYAEMLAGQLRLSYPTATLAMMVKAGETPTVHAEAEKVHDFLFAHRADFQIGASTIEQFVTRGQVPIEPEVQRDITRIQRVRQITPSDAAMNALLNKGVDSAYAVVRYDRDEFVAAFAADVGGTASAALIHARAQQVHNAVLNIAMSYLLASNSPGIGVHSPAQIVDPAPAPPDNVGDVIAYASLEKLLGEMDYCECDHCRSILSPAAYLVDLLMFLDRDEVRWEQFRVRWKVDHASVPYPFGYATMQDYIDAGSPAEVVETPLEVLLSRRPDLAHLPLTCENTNTPLPYIDVVNETLEYFVANKLRLTGYAGHSTEEQADPAELLADPQFVQDAAYDILADTTVPGPPAPPLPFHQPLERLRRVCGGFSADRSSLPLVMEALRKDESLERASDADYGWRDIWMEELRISRPEHGLLVDGTRTLQSLYGFASATPDAEVLDRLSNARDYTRRVEIGYDDLVEILRTRFVNPHGGLIPKLERLGIPLRTIKDLKDGLLTDAQFAELLAPHLDPAAYGGDIKAWLTNQGNYDKVMSLLVLADPSGANDVGSFARLEFRYADPARAAEHVRPFEFVRLLRFIRLWKKLGWSIAETDKAIGALYPVDQAPLDGDDAVDLPRLDAGFRVLLPRLGVLRRVITRLNLTVIDDLLPLLACFAPMDTYGATSLYRRMFLNPSLLKQDATFADDGYGNLLSDNSPVSAHEPALRAAFALTGAEFRLIYDAVGFQADTALTVESASEMFRHGWLARTLKLGVAELLALVRCGQIDPFAAIDPVAPSMPAFLDLLDALRAAQVKPSQALYLIWNSDISGTLASSAAQVDEFARGLRTGFLAVDGEFSIVDDPEGQIARARMGLVYDGAATDLFFGMLNDSLVSDVSYSHPVPELENAIVGVAAGKLSYDAFRKRLAYAGVLTPTARDALKSVPAAPAPFQDAIDRLYRVNQQAVQPFFQRYPELSPLYDAYVASPEPVGERRSALLENFLPTLVRRRKRQLAVQAIAAAAEADAAFVEPVLGDASVLHGAVDHTRAALEDLTALDRAGLSVRFFFREWATGPVDLAQDAGMALDYGERRAQQLPAHADRQLSGVWDGYLEAPTSGLYHLRVEAEPGAVVTLALAGVAVTLVDTGGWWSTDLPVDLRAGALYAVTLTAEKLRTTLSLSWQTIGRGWDVVPQRYLYSATVRDRMSVTYARFLKVASLSQSLHLSAGEVAELCSRPEHFIDGDGWLNRLPVTHEPDAPTAKSLRIAFGALLAYARVKAEFTPGDERLLVCLKDPHAATREPGGLLYAITRWSPASLKELLTRFALEVGDLRRVGPLTRIFTAFSHLTTLQITAEALSAAATNEPAASAVRDLQAALRARYTDSDWLAVLKPINDELRALQRNALVAYILHQMRANPASAHIDTADKLFEYFLMDVSMEPCMQTSRIRHALSSVQLFTERCLMNLEPRVASAAINAKQWEWMRLYRVWEANRKIFLWPENWLEPELRDDRSPFFDDLMSELLQGDITEDRAATALGNYLSRLAVVAKLEPAAMYQVEGDPAHSRDDVVHVVARTPGADRKYYHRAREGGSWTPWRKIPLDIEDNPVGPVVWRGRLFLFWLRLLTKPATGNAEPFTPGQDRNLAEMKSADIKKSAPVMTVQALLCWSEQINNEWQPTRTSDVARPTMLRESNPLGPLGLDRSALSLSFADEGAGLRIKIGGATGSYLLFHPHSQAVRQEEAAVRAPVDAPDRFVVPSWGPLDFAPGTLSLDYDPGTGNGDNNLNRDVLEYPYGGRTVRPLHPLRHPWDAPFLFEDHPHVFYVTTEQSTVMTSEWTAYDDSYLTPKLKVPPILWEKPKLRPDLAAQVLKDRQPGIDDLRPMELFLTEDAYIHRAIGETSALRFGDVRIGPAGKLASGDQ